MLFHSLLAIIVDAPEPIRLRISVVFLFLLQTCQLHFRFVFLELLFSSLVEGSELTFNCLSICFLNDNAHFVA